MLVTLELDGNDAHAGLEPDRAELERRTEHERRAEGRVPGERELLERREDPDTDVALALCRQHEDRLREADLERERLHRRLVEAAGIGEDSQLVAGQRRVGEDVGDDVPEGARHGASL